MSSPFETTSLLEGAPVPTGDLRRAKIHSISAQIDEYEELLPYLTHEEKRELDGLLSGIYCPLWEPFDGPQSVALNCEADELFYGGAAGGGKTDLIIGAALTRHWRSIIFRREYAELKGIRERAEELYGTIGKFNGNAELWRIHSGEFAGARVEFGACQYEGDEKKFQGRPHDLKAFDEITQFTEKQFRFLITWNRTTRIGQRVRSIATGNPPVSAEGQWVVEYWAPWLDPRHPNPAKQGELRWFITVPERTKKLTNLKNGDPIEGFRPGKDLELEAGNVEVFCEYDSEVDNEVLEPRSRTFIKAKVEDNPRLMETGYRRTLQNLPEPLRSMMLRGDFGIGHEDEEWQIIPTDWIRAAQARWAATFEEYIAKLELAYSRKAEEALKAKPSSSIESGVQASPEPIPTVLALPFRPDLRVRGGGPKVRVPEPPLPASLLGLGGSIRPIVDHKLEQEKIQAGRTEAFENLKARRDAAEKEGAVGVDVSRGGRDDSIISERLEGWFAPLIAIPGAKTNDGNEVVQTLVDLGFSNRRIHIDITGVGTSPVDIGRMIGMDIVAMVGSNKSIKKDRSGKLGFVNARAEWWWGFREALDPVLGDDIALPPDPGLVADLTSVRWSLAARGIQVEPKEHIKARIGRSPDKGDAIVMAHAKPYLVGEGYLKYMKELVDEGLALREAAEKKSRQPYERSDQS